MNVFFQFKKKTKHFVPTKMFKTRVLWNTDPNNLNGATNFLYSLLLNLWCMDDFRAAAYQGRAHE